ncbi:MAG: polysaccharide biosynthesis tyrosine autokinase [Bacteroidetes bacterium]|nr:polysaccharide biosynthesis tyrosine autokinase [Bacteroidota bacterium]
MFINTKQTPASNPFDFQQIAIRYIHHWYFFIIGLVLALSAAFIYLQITNPIYEIKAALMVKDDEKKTNDKPALYELDLPDSHKSAENEIGILQSRTLISQVVNDLQLWAGYTTKKGLSNQDLYRSSPIKFKLLNARRPGSLDKKNIAIKIKNQELFYLKTPDGAFKTHHFKDTITDDVGTWQLVPDTNLQSYTGSVINIKLSDPDKVSDQYQKAIGIALLDKKAASVELSVNDNVPERGEDVLNDLMKVYNQAQLIEKNRTTKNTMAFIDQRLASLTGEVSGAENQVENFRSSRGLTDISSQSQVYLQNVQANDNLLNQVNIKLSTISGIERYLDLPQNTDDPPSVIGIEDPALSSLIEKLSTLQLQHSQLLATVPEGNPAFNPINKQIAQVKTSIKEKIASIKASLLDTKNQLESFNSRFQSSIKDMPGQEREYIDLKRQQSVKENLYVYLLQKREEVSLSYATTLADARIVDQAYTGPIKWPHKSIVYAVAFLLGFTLPAGFIYGKRIVQNQITSLRDIENATEIPVLAELSFTKTRNPIVISDRKQFAITEQIRMLRTNLLRLLVDKESGRVSLITSSVAGEGKSFVSINLGISLALSGKKTIILEMDLRKPKISEAFGLSKRHPGLTDFLTGDASKPSIIQPSGVVDNLDILSCGSINDTIASELFEKKNLAELIKYLRTTYDDIVIDSPPLHLVTDAMILSKFADVTLYVIRQGHTRKAELAFINTLAKGEKLPKMNIIFNGIQRARYGYGYKYDTKYYN